MLTFVLLVVLGGGIAAYAVTESESSQRATKPDDLHGGDGDDDPDDDDPGDESPGTAVEDEPDTVVGEIEEEPDAFVGEVGDEARTEDDPDDRVSTGDGNVDGVPPPVDPMAGLAHPDAPRRDSPQHPERQQTGTTQSEPIATDPGVVGTRTATRADTPAASEAHTRRTGARSGGRRPSVSAEQRRLRDGRARALEAVVVAGPVPGEVGDVAPARTAIEGRYADVAHTALWRRLLSLIAIVGVVFGLVLVATLVIFVAFAIGADLVSNI